MKNEEIKKNIKRIMVLVIVLIYILIPSLIMSLDVYAWEDPYYYLPLFETSDVHGYIADVSGEETLYPLAYIADKVNDVRGHGIEFRKDKALFLDGGDLYQGNPLSNLVQGDSVSAVYSMMQYDAVCVGNHEFDWEIETTIDFKDKTMKDYSIDDIVGENTTPIVASNIYKNGEKVTFAHDYLIFNKTAVNKQGDEITVRIAVIGFVGEYSSEIMAKKFINLGYSIQLDYDKLNELASSLEKNDECDATVLLVHEDAKTIANSLGSSTCIDLVLGGHSHQATKGKTSWGLPYLEPSSYGNAYTYCEMAFVLKDDNCVFNSIENEKVFKTKDNEDLLKNKVENADELDQNVLTLTNKIIDKLNVVLKEKIGYVTTNISRKDYIEGSGGRSTPNGNWVTSIMAKIVDADISFVNNGGLRVDILLENGESTREITVADVYSMFPFGNIVYCYELTYEELLQVFDYAMTDYGNTFFAQMTGIDCYYVDGKVQAFVIDNTLIYEDGTWSDGWKDKTVKVAVSEYLATTEKAKNPTDLQNPFILWNSTPKLLEKGKTDNEYAIEVLKEEAKNNDGLLYVDTQAHFINHAYDHSNDIIDTPNENNGFTPVQIICIVILGSIVVGLIVFFIVLFVSGGKKVENKEENKQ